MIKMRMMINFRIFNSISSIFIKIDKKTKKQNVQEEIIF